MQLHDHISKKYVIHPRTLQEKKQLEERKTFPIKLLLPAARHRTTAKYSSIKQVSDY